LSAVFRFSDLKRPSVDWHAQARWHMLGTALTLRDGREVSGQRLQLVPLGT
jgi:hypothetical protein